MFSSHYSFFKSILTFDEAGKIDPTGHVSVFSIAREHGLKEVFVVDSKFTGFPEAYISKSCGIPLRFGFKVSICADMADKSDESRKTEHKAIVFLLDSGAYEPAIEIYTTAATEGFYYHPRIDLKTLNRLWHKSLDLMTCPFDNFIHRNLLCNGLCVPEWGRISPVVSFARDMGLPFESLLTPAIRDYAGSAGFELQEVHPVHYYSRKCFDAYLALRAIGNNAETESPNIDFFCSREFCFEAYQEKIRHG